jgi:hypothetical protein
MAHGVFICHSAEDRVVALAACAKLEASGIRCWIAPRDPIAGIPYPRQLVDAIGAAKAVLLIFSGKANESAHVLRELGEAADRNKPVIPFRTENVLPTGDLKYYIQLSNIVTKPGRKGTVHQIILRMFLPSPVVRTIPT